MINNQEIRTEGYAADIDVAVLLIFFVRDEVLELTFEQIRKARPSTLFLWQDGPRKDRADDLIGIESCRKIVSNIDWQCNIYRCYNDENIGCDPSIFYAYKWVFQHVDKCIFLEDDQVPNISFFRYCKELLDYYENDTRISHICGYNCLETLPNCETDYFFSTFGSGAWATWKRVVDEWEGDYGFLSDTYAWQNLLETEPHLAKNARKNAIHRKEKGKEYWESIIGCNCLLNHHLAIIPNTNLVSNKGLTKNSTHSDTKTFLLPRSMRKLFYMPTPELSWPLKHPKYVYENVEYTKQVKKVLSIGYPTHRFMRRIESLFYKALYNCFKIKIK